MTRFRLLAALLVVVCGAAIVVITTRSSGLAVSRTVPFVYERASENAFTEEYMTSAAVSPGLDDCTAADLEVNRVRRAFEPQLGLRVKPGGRACALDAIAPVTLVAANGKTLPPVNTLDPGYHAKIPLRPGQYAIYTVHWAFNCDPAFDRGATARLRLPGGVLSWSGVPAPRRCLRDTHDVPYELGGWRGIHPPSKIPWAHVRVRIEGAPSTIRPGQTVRFTAVLENPDDTAVVLAPCPAYDVDLAQNIDVEDDIYGDRIAVPGARFSSLLNCRAVSDLLPAHSATAFRMVLHVPDVFRYDAWERDHVIPKGVLSWRLSGSDFPYAYHAVEMPD